MRETISTRADTLFPDTTFVSSEAYVVPLSSHAVAILRELHPLTGRGRYLFTGIRPATEPMSENTVNAALRRMGFDKETMTGTGFRAMATTRPHKMGRAPAVVESQQAAAERHKQLGRQTGKEQM